VAKAQNELTKTNLLSRIRAAKSHGINKRGLKLPPTRSSYGEYVRKLLDELCQEGSIINTGTAAQTLFIHKDYFDPELAIRSRVNTVFGGDQCSLASSAQLKKGLKGIYLRLFDDTLDELVRNDELQKFKWGKRVLYGKATTEHASGSKAEISKQSVLMAYRSVVDEKGYADVLVCEVLSRLPDAAPKLLSSLLTQACKEGWAVASGGDWSLSSDAERAAAVYINGQPHLRIRIND